MSLDNICTDFISAEVSSVNSDSAFSHVVSRGVLLGSQKLWVKKEMRSPNIAKIEILAQEFFRLIIPHQPETRLMHNPTTGVHYILSEEVFGYHKLPKTPQNFENGTFKGLGQVIVISMFLQETDLKNGNLGINAKGTVIKIDGDWCFSEGRHNQNQYQYELTPEAIDALPYPRDFDAYNWLDIIQQGIKQPKSNLVSADLTNSPQFRHEVNQALLKICLLPDCVIEYFVDAYMPAGGQRFINLIKKRREKLMASAIQNTSFQAYLKSAQTEENTQKLIDQIISFTANGKKLMLPDFNATQQSRQDVKERLNAIRDKVNQNHSAQYKRTFSGLFYKPTPVNGEQDSWAPIIVSPISKTPSLRVEQGFGAQKSNSLHQHDQTISKNNSSHVSTKELSANTKFVQAFIDINIKDLLSKIYACRVNDEDTILINYVREKGKSAKTTTSTEEKILMLDELENTLSSVNSPQVIATKEATKSLRDSNYFWTTGKKEKAGRIEKALSETQLEQRRYVITEQSPNKVQEALASHRHFGRHGKVYRNQNEIDLENAAKTYQCLKKKFTETSSILNLNNIQQHTPIISSNNLLTTLIYKR